MSIQTLLYRLNPRHDWHAETTEDGSRFTGARAAVGIRAPRTKDQ